MDGGQTQSEFFKSADDLFIIKVIKENEFNMFKLFAINYFKHVNRITKDKKRNLLAKIYGMYEVKLNYQNTFYCIVMENLFVNINQDQYIQVYDLKGSEKNRLEKENRNTFLDSNFKIDRNSEPIPILE